jgi:hypothetical protein
VGHAPRCPAFLGVTVKPGDLVTCADHPKDGTHRWTLLTRYPDQFSETANPEVYSVKEDEVGLLLAITDVTHENGQEYTEALVLFGEHLGWNSVTAFKPVV